MPVKMLKTTTKMKQIMVDERSESNTLRLPKNAVERQQRIHAHTCSYKQQRKSSPKLTNTLPFYNFTERHATKDAEAPTPSSIEIHRSHDHRSDLIRWQLHNGHPQHHHQHRCQQLNTNGNARISSSSSPSPAAPQKHFSKKFSFTQHSNHLSRFYMIFIVFLIYLLDKINCDQGED